MPFGPKLRLALLGFIIAVVLLFVLIKQSDNGATFPPLPTPNGYDDFIRAGNLLKWPSVDPTTMNQEALHNFVGDNAESLKLLQLGLTRPCSVHTAEFLTNNPSLLTDSMAIKKLAQFGIAIGRLAELEGRTNDAIGAYTEGIRYGNEVSRGGFVIHRLVGIACEAQARSQLARLATNANVEEIKHISTALEKMDAETVSWLEIQANERLYLRQAIQSYDNPIALLQSWWKSRSVLRQVKARHLAEISKRRRFLLELGLRHYFVIHQTPPKHLSDLSPDYLGRIPLNPFTENLFEYQTAGTNWHLQTSAP